MRPVMVSVPIDAPREQVHELLLDLSARPSFTDHCLDEFRMRRVDTVGVGAGARFKVKGTDGWMDTVISSVDRPYRISEQGHCGRLNRVPTHTMWELVEQASPGGCELKVVFWTEPDNPFDKLRERPLKRKLGKGWKKATERLKQLIESEGAISHVQLGGESRLGL
ncbi:hypothetical protein BH10ACT11_BH10ACT11_14960 [soil metagenome]